MILRKMQLKVRFYVEGMQCVCSCEEGKICMVGQIFKFWNDFSFGPYSKKIHCMKNGTILGYLQKFRRIMTINVDK